MDKNSTFKGRSETIIIACLFLCMILGFFYLVIRSIYLIIAPFTWMQMILGWMLLGAELVGLIHTTGYFISMINVLKRNVSNIAFLPTPKLENYPPIAIVVPSYKEPLSVIKDTLTCFYNLEYPNKFLYLLDDTRYDKPWETPEKIKAYKKSVEELCEWMGVNLFRRKWRGAKAGIVNDFVKFLNGGQIEGLEYRAFQEHQPHEAIKYITIFDADMNPFPDFLEIMTPHIEKDDKVAFIQSPQYYSNFELNRVARSAGLQQVIFYEYICEGKGLSNSMFCCGSNVVLRVEALSAVGGFDETSVTEDFATSLKFHLQGWKTLYYNKVLAFGMGPEDLGGYFKQQFRWALGTLSLGMQLPKQFILNFKKLSLQTWWEYFLSSTYYLAGWFFLMMFIFPIIFLFFNISAFNFDTLLYLTIFFPYLAISISMVCFMLYKRNFLPWHIISSVMIGAVTFPVFIKAGVYALFGRHGSFTVTPKGQSEVLPLTSLWAQLIPLFLCITALAWGIERLYYEREPFFGIIANLIWCTYNAVILGSIFYFNTPEKPT